MITRARMLVALVAVASLAACSENSVTNLRSPDSSPSLSSSGGSCSVPVGGVLTQVSTGPDQYGYNRCAHIFVGTYGSYCAQRGAPDNCGGVDGSTKLTMKWTPEWDRGNATAWADPNGYNGAWLDNEANGADFSEHFKTRWDAGCVSSGGAASTAGNTCIWGQFEVLMDQGKTAGEHVWYANKVKPAGYGN